MLDEQEDTFRTPTNDTLFGSYPIYEEPNALYANFNAFIKISIDMLKAIHPILGIENNSIFKLCKLTQRLDYFSEDEYNLLLITASLSNVGFIYIPRKVILEYKNNPEKLTQIELDQIYKHPIYAEKLTKSLTGKFKEVPLLLRTSCEFWDGSGYPYGISMENIPKIARFLSIARYYVESPLSKAETVEKIIENTGILFYPEGVRLFLKATKQVALPEKIKEILFSELSPGMVLAAPLHTPTGVMLFPKDRPLDDTSLEKLIKFNNLEPIQDRVLVFRND